MKTYYVTENKDFHVYVWGNFKYGDTGRLTVTNKDDEDEVISIPNRFNDTYADIEIPGSYFTEDNLPASFIYELHRNGIWETIAAGTLDFAPTAGEGSTIAWSNVTDKPSNFPSTINLVSNLQASLDAKASDTDVIKLSGAQTVAGVKTFSSSPVVPDGSWAIGKTTGLQAALDLKAPLASPTFTGTVSGITASMVGLGSVTNAAQVELSGAQTIAGIKTFSSSPVVPDSSFAIAKVTGLQTALDAKVPKDYSMPSATSDTPIIIRQSNTVDDSSAELMQVYLGSVKGMWLNEGGNVRSESYNANQVAIKAFGWRGTGTHNTDIQQWFSKTGQVYAIGSAGEPRLGANRISGAHVVILAEADSVPSGLPAGTLIARY